jgi:predicted permease
MLNNLRYAVRMLAKNPGFTAVAICSLAIGIGANTAIFSLADAMLLRPLPVLKPSAVVTVTPVLATQTFGSNALSYPDYLDFRDRNRSFDGLLAFAYGPFGYAPNRVVLPEMKYGVYASGNFFSVLGVKPALGRAFRPDEDTVPGKDAVVVLSHDFWMSQFDGRPSAIGSQMRLNGIDFTLIGVTPESFTGIDNNVRPAFYVPFAMAPRLQGADNLTRRDIRWVTIKGRLKPGVTNARAAADLNALAATLQKTYPKADASLHVRVETNLQERVEQSPPDAGLVAMLLLLALCVLLIACANVAGLLVSRSTARAREIAVRLAIGAARWQLVRQLFTENLLLALAGGGLGIAVAYAGAKFFSTIPIPTDLPISIDFRVDHRALVFTLVVSIASTFLFGLVPALRSSRADLTSALKARDASVGGRKGLWGRNTLVAGQIAVSLLLLIVSAALFQGFRSALAQGPGFRTDHLLLASFDTTLVHYTDAQSKQFYKHLIDRTRSAPGVASAALAAFVPMAFDGGDTRVVPAGYRLPKGERSIDVFDDTVGDGYFETMGIPLLRGRGFLKTDQPNTPLVAVVNEHFAHHYWPNQNALGKQFHLYEANGPLVQIVGIAKTTKYLWISEPPFDFVYLPFSQNPSAQMHLITASYAQDASTLLPVLRHVVRRIDSNMPLFDVRTMHNLYTQRAIKTPDIIIETVAGMGSMALILAAVGLFGLITYSVSRRTREIGIRMAIGADRQTVAKMVLRQGLTLAVAGTVVGLVLGLFAAHAITLLMITSFGTTNPFLLATLALPLIAIALLATYIPARRASRVDPMVALRDE